MAYAIVIESTCTFANNISPQCRAIGLSLRGSSPGFIQSATRDGLQLRCEAIKALRRGLDEPHNVYFEAILATMIHLTYVEVGNPVRSDRSCPSENKGI